MSNLPSTETRGHLTKKHWSFYVNRIMAVLLILSIFVVGLRYLIEISDTLDTVAFFTLMLGIPVWIVTRPIIIPDADENEQQKHLEQALLEKRGDINYFKLIAGLWVFIGLMSLIIFHFEG